MNATNAARTVLLRFSVTSTLFVYCSTGDPYPAHFVVAVNTQPSWSADGDQIAYCHQDNDGKQQQSSEPREIWVYSFSTDSSVYWAQGTEPAWSPNGSKLAYIGADGHLWVASGPPPSRPSSVATLSGASQPRWSPDGRQLLIRRSTGGDTSSFYIVNADGSGVVSTQVEGVSADFLSDASTLVYAEPGGKRFSTVRWKTMPHLPIFLASVAPGSTQFLCRRPVKGDIGYSRLHEQSLRCWMMSSAGREQHAVSDCAGVFCWSPDGEKIVLEREESGAIDLWVLTLGSNHQDKLLPASES